MIRILGTLLLAVALSLPAYAQETEAAPPPAAAIAPAKLIPATDTTWLNLQKVAAEAEKNRKAEKAAKEAEAEKRRFEEEKVGPMVALLSVLRERARVESASSLVSRLLDSAEEALNDKRYQTASELLERAEGALNRSRPIPMTRTAPVGPITETLLEALTRVRSAQNAGFTHPRIQGAAELVLAAEESLKAGRVSEADRLAERAIQLLSTFEFKVEPVAERQPGKIDLNHASRRELLTLPGITPEMVENIIWFRKWIGPFHSVEELRFVPRFSSGFVKVYRPLITATL